MRVVGDQRVRIGARGRPPPRAARPGRPQALGAARPEPDRLAVFQLDQLLARRGRLLQRRERVVVEDRTVLVDLDERRALMVGGGPEHPGQVPAVGVDRPRREARFGAQRQRHRVERVSSEPNGVDLVTLPCSEVGEYWPLVSP